MKRAAAIVFVVAVLILFKIAVIWTKTLLL
jgi:hypothetical protein